MKYAIEFCADGYRVGSSAGDSAGPFDTEDEAREWVTTDTLRWLLARELRGLGVGDE